MEETREEDTESFGKIKVFSSDDEKLKALGELLSNKSSRDIIKLLIKKGMYTNEIAKKLGLGISLVIYHIQKMEAIGLLEITNKKIIRTGEEHRFFRIPHGMLIFPEKSEKETNNGLLKKIFKDGIKFVSLVIAGIVTYFSTREFSQSEVQKMPRYELPNLIEISPFIFPLIVVIIGLVIMYFTKKKKG